MYNEIRNDYMFGPAAGDGTDENNPGLLAGITIDGWTSDNDAEEGTVIAAVLLSRHGDIIVDWHDNGARLFRNVLQAIDEAKARLREIWSEKTAIPDGDLAALSDRLKALFNQRDETAKLYLLKDDQGELDLIRVNNWDDDFEQRLSDAADRWKESEGEFGEELYGYLQAYGYDIDVLDYETETI